MAGGKAGPGLYTLEKPVTGDLVSRHMLPLELDSLVTHLWRE